MKYCNVCNGSGEGAYAGSVCPACRGIDLDRQTYQDDIDDDWRFDARLEERLAEEE